jgi:hypothetical protein
MACFEHAPYADADEFVGIALRSVITPQHFLPDYSREWARLYFAGREKGPSARGFRRRRKEFSKSISTSAFKRLARPRHRQARSFDLMSGRWSAARKVDWLAPEMKNLNDEADENDNVLAGLS